MPRGGSSGGRSRSGSHDLPDGAYIAIGVVSILFLLFIGCCVHRNEKRRKKESRARAEFLADVDELAAWSPQNILHVVIPAAFHKEKVHPPFYSYSELSGATENFSRKNKLAAYGVYGAVYKGKLADGTLLAVRKLFQDRLTLSDFLNEALLIMKIKHQNLIQLKGCCIEKDLCMLVYEYAENGNLADALWGKEDGKRLIGKPNDVKETEHQIKIPLSWQQRFHISMGIAYGLLYLHEELQPHIIHVRPVNILIDGAFNAKVTDFGLASAFSQKEFLAKGKHATETSGYLAPDYVTQQELKEKTNVFSFGVVLLEIVSGRKYIDQSLPPDKVSLVKWVYNLRKQGSVLDILDSSISHCCNHGEIMQVLDIAFACLCLNPAQRPTMSQVVSRLQETLGNQTYVQTSSEPQFSLNLKSPSTFVQETCIRLDGVCGASLELDSSVPGASDQKLDQMTKSVCPGNMHLT